MHIVAYINVILGLSEASNTDVVIEYFITKESYKSQERGPLDSFIASKIQISISLF